MSNDTPSPIRTYQRPRYGLRERVRVIDDVVLEFPGEPEPINIRGASGNVTEITYTPTGHLYAVSILYSRGSQHPEETRYFWRTETLEECQLEKIYL